MEPEGPTPSQQKKSKLNFSWRPETQAPPTPAVPVGAQENESQHLSSQDVKLLSGTFGTFLCKHEGKNYNNPYQYIQSREITLALLDLELAIL